MKAKYIQGETIQPTATAASAASAVFRWWPASDDSARSAAKALIHNLKSSATMGELSTNDKTASEIEALSAIINSGAAKGSGSVELTDDGEGNWSAAVDSSTLYGVYEYAIFATGSDSVTTAVATGTFTVTGDPSAASIGGGPFTIHTRFC